jgi:methyltransferase (TIGR00027 family)
MRTGRPSRTARQNALFRALEARRPPAQRVADDHVAVHFLSPEFRVLAELARLAPVHKLLESFIDRRWPCARAGVVARTRLIDDAFVNHLPAVEQVLLLGAGFDSRAYRLDGMSEVRVFEVDHPSTQEEKRRILARTFDHPPGHVTFVPVVFGKDDPAVRLASAGFTTGAPTLVLWEGVTNYLDADSVTATFAFLASALPAGSPVLFTYVHRGMLDGSASFAGGDTTMRAVQRVGEPFTFGFDPQALPGYLEERGFQLGSDTTVAEAAERYYANGRRPEAPAYYHVVEARRA